MAVPKSRMARLERLEQSVSFDFRREDLLLMAPLFASAFRARRAERPLTAGERALVDWFHPLADAILRVRFPSLLLQPLVHLLDGFTESERMELANAWDPGDDPYEPEFPEPSPPPGFSDAADRSGWR